VKFVAAMRSRETGRVWYRTGRGFWSPNSEHAHEFKSFTEAANDMRKSEDAKYAKFVGTPKQVKAWADKGRLDKQDLDPFVKTIDEATKILTSMYQRPVEPRQDSPRIDLQKAPEKPFTIEPGAGNPVVRAYAEKLKEMYNHRSVGQFSFTGLLLSFAADLEANK